MGYRLLFLVGALAMAPISYEASWLFVLGYFGVMYFQYKLGSN